MSKNKKGSILAYSLIILAMMFAIVGSMSAVSVLEKKSAGSSQSSVQSFQVADNAAQLAIKNINSVIGSATNNKLSDAFATCAPVAGVATVIATLESDKPYTLTFKKKDGLTATTCDVLVSDIAVIKSVGNYKNTTRAVEVAVGTEDNNPCAGLTAPIVDPSGNKYGFVVGTDNRCWLDRNLGAVSYPTVITGPTDPNGHGWYFQWGRGVDGHQLLTSAVTLGPVTSSTPGSNFIQTSSMINNWYSGVSPSPDSLWSGIDDAYGVNNNPCPTGWHVPTGKANGELDKYFDSTGLGSASCSSDCINKLFNVKNLYGTGPGLQLTAAGFRKYSNGINSNAGSMGFYWTSNYVSGDNAGIINYTSTYVNEANLTSPKGNGGSVRCIRNQ